MIVHLTERYDWKISDIRCVEYVILYSCKFESKVLMVITSKDFYFCHCIVVLEFLETCFHSCK